MDRPLVAVVLAGGVGTRLYPASRSDRPKQFCSLGGDDSLLARTVDRAGFADDVLVVTRPSFAAAVRDHAPAADVLVEPEGKDTGPAVTYATHVVGQRYGDDAVAVLLPSDHHVTGAFEPTVRRGAQVAATSEALVTFGVPPDRPETGYGYVEPGTDHGDHRSVRAFHEKPDAETAADYVARGYLWNAGIFAWTPAAFLAAAGASPLEPLVEALGAGDPAAGFAAVDPTSVDTAVLERADDVAVVPVEFEWDDLGTWDALERVLPADEHGNATLGESLAVDASGNVVAGDAHVSLVGVEGLVVAAFGDRVLVVPKAEAGRVRDVVDRLRATGRF
jgi:mannose-1-phosphate guanylyltransferase